MPLRFAYGLAAAAVPLLHGMVRWRRWKSGCRRKGSCTSTRWWRSCSSTSGSCRQRKPGCLRVHWCILRASTAGGVRARIVWAAFRVCCRPCALSAHRRMASALGRCSQASCCGACTVRPSSGCGAGLPRARCCGASVRGCAVVARARVVLARVEDDGRPRLPLPRGAPGRPVAAPRGRAVRHLANERRRGLTGVDYSSTRGLNRAGPVPAAGYVPPQWSVVAGGGRATLALRRIRRSAIVRTIVRTNPRRSRIRPGTSRPSPMRCSTTSFRR